MLLTLEVKEKDQAPLGQQISAVGMFFYKKGDLTKGNRYQLGRNSDNPKHTNCFEVRSRHITMATMNKNFSRLLALFVDENIICDSYGSNLSNRLIIYYWIIIIIRININPININPSCPDTTSLLLF